MKEFVEKLISRLEKDYKPDIECFESKDDYEASITRYNRLLNIVNQLAEEYNDGWIPCSEKLPDKEEFLRNDGRFIVTDGNRRYQSIYDIYQGGFRTLVLSTNGGIERGWNFEVDNCVIAWQPLPETYQQKGE